MASAGLIRERDVKAAHKILAIPIAAAIIVFAGALYYGSIASAPAPAIVVSPPPDLPVEPVFFKSGSGSQLQLKYWKYRCACE